MASALLIQDLKRDEGVRLSAYPDPLTHAAPWTIGYGHTGRDVVRGMTIDGNRADGLLIGDAEHAEMLCSHFLPWWGGLCPVRQDAVANMMFNMGWDDARTPQHEGLSGFSDFLAKMQAGAYTLAASAMLDSRWARQVHDRAARLAHMILYGARQ